VTLICFVTGMKTNAYRHGFGGTYRIDGQRVNSEDVNNALTEVCDPLVS
jgi:hypothetical protein